MRFPWRRRVAQTPPSEPPISESITQTVREVDEQSQRIKALARETSCLARDAEVIKEQNHFGWSLKMAMGGVDY